LEQQEQQAELEILVLLQTEPIRADLVAAVAAVWLQEHLEQEELAECLAVAVEGAEAL
jgi:hypothetical protein